MNTEIINLYSEMFEVKLVETQEELNKVYSLRYQVYTKENGWEPENSEEFEKDACDKNSIHCLLIFKPTGEAVGTVRMVLPTPDNLESSYPIQAVCTHPMLKDKAYISRMGEISRMAISKEARKKIISNKRLWWIIIKTGQNPKKVLSDLGGCLSAGLMEGILKMVTQGGLQGAFAVMEPVFIRMLRKHGINCKLLGKPINYHGRRQPCYFDIDTLIKAKKANINIYNFISHDGDVEATLRTTCLNDKDSPFKSYVA